MARTLDWMKEVDFVDLLEGDAKLIASQCGLDVLLRLWENLLGLNLYLSGRPIQEAQRRYIQKFYNGKNAKELAITLGVSDRFVYDVLKEGQKK